MVSMGVIGEGGGTGVRGDGGGVVRMGVRGWVGQGYEGREVRGEGGGMHSGRMGVRGIE